MPWIGHSFTDLKLFLHKFPDDVVNEMMTGLAMMKALKMLK